MTLLEWRSTAAITLKQMPSKITALTLPSSSPNHLNEIEIRFYGDAAVAQGNESWKKKDGTTGKFVWTDTWIRRGGKWQIVAAEDLVPAGTPTGRP
jgi:hypothetical protein